MAAIAVEELKTKAKEVGIDIEAVMKKAQRIRAELSKKVREFWASVEGVEMRQALQLTAYQTGYADKLREIAKEVGLRERYQKVAEDVKLGDMYRYTWGKPVSKE